MRRAWDAVVIGSGFGSVMAGTPLFEAYGSLA